MKTISINGQNYELVCRRISNRSAIYRGTDSYLRIGARTIIGHELAIHKRLAGIGFPVATLLDEGEVNGLAYFIERSLGELVFGDRFDAEVQTDGAISDASCAAYLAVVQQWAHAQLRNLSSADITDDFASMIQLQQLQHNLPDIALASERAFAKAMSRLRDFPTVWTHGDFHPYNVCAGGVIDLETTRSGVAGYDIMTGIVTVELFPPDPTTYRFTPQQKAHYFSAVDQIYAAFGLPAPSVYATDYALCKMMHIVTMVEKWPSEQRRWVYAKYRTMVQTYESSSGS